MSDRRPTPVGAQRSASAAPVSGVIETIADGLSLVLTYPLVALVPLAIDLALWSGVRISPESLLRRWSDLHATADSLGYDSDVLPLAALGVPSLLKTVSHDDVYSISSGMQVAPGSWLVAATTVAALALASTLLGTIFRVPLALVIRADHRTPVEIARATGIAWVRLLGLFALVIGTVVLVASPILIGAALFLVAGLDIMPLVGAALVIPATAAAIYLMFTPEAIVLSEVGPLRAAYLSFNVVRRNFWPALGLLGSVFLISEGLSVLWRSQIETPFGLLVGVLGNAFVGAGLALAAMRFYDDRLRRWRPEMARPFSSGTT
jgi:hypothetical protein